MAQAYIVDAVRTAGGRRGGRLSNWHPVDLAAQVLKALVRRSGCDPAAIDDVILGCVMQVGEQGMNIARNAVLAAGLPESVPGTTVDRQCGSSQQALHFAAQGILSGMQDLVIAAGVESMSRIPMQTVPKIARDGGLGHSKSPDLEARYPGVVFSQFTGAEMLAAKYRLKRDALDAWALQSHQRAAQATAAGRFDDEIVPVSLRAADGVAGAELHRHDEGIRAGATLEGIASVATILPGGVVTAASASQICDGSSGVLLASERGLKALNLAPLARIHHLSLLGHDPVVMLEAPLPATGAALRKTGLGINDIDLFEVNEAFAPVPLAWLQATHADPARLNVNGGAIALGHPLGASGTRLMATLVHELRRRGGRFGLQTMCEGGGMANVTVVERV
jgi:acetyl-CoA C-acetyltransferase